MSLQAFSRILRPLTVATSRQFLGRRLPRRVGERSIFYVQQKRESTKDELGVLVLGLGLLSTSIVWAAKEGAWSINMTPAERAKLQEQEPAGEE